MSPNTLVFLIPSHFSVSIGISLTLPVTWLTSTITLYPPSLYVTLCGPYSLFLPIPCFSLPCACEMCGCNTRLRHWQAWLGTCTLYPPSVYFLPPLEFGPYPLFLPIPLFSLSFTCMWNGRVCACVCVWVYSRLRHWKAWIKYTLPSISPLPVPYFYVPSRCSPAQYVCCIVFYRFSPFQEKSDGRRTGNATLVSLLQTATHFW